MQVFKSEIPCKGENCSSFFIQNKKYHLCSECVYQKNHAGKSRQQVQLEKQKAKKPLLIGDDEEGKLNELKQSLVNEEGDEGLKRFVKTLSKPALQSSKSINKRSKKQAITDREYLKTITDFDYTEEKVCSGCNMYQGGEIRLSHSHVISRQDCKNIGKPELVYDKENLRYHCMDFGEHEGCHRKWENPKQRHLLSDYKRNLEYINKAAPELLSKYQYDFYRS